MWPEVELESDESFNKVRFDVELRIRARKDLAYATTREHKLPLQNLCVSKRDNFKKLKMIQLKF